MSIVDPEASRLRDEIAQVLGDAALAGDLIASVRRGIGETEGFSEVARWFGQAVDAVRVDIRQDRRGRLLASLLQDDTELTDAEVTRCLRLVYWRMINTFQGDLAELLAMGPISDCVTEWIRRGTVPASAQTIWGRDIRMRSSTRPTGWLKGADALVVSEEERSHLILHAVVEIKSYPVDHAQAVCQLARHLDRFRGGVRIGPRQWAPADVFFTARQDRGNPRRTVSDAVGSDVSRLIVMPKADGHAGRSRRHDLGATTMIDLPWSAAQIAEAAYSMTAWFLGQVGRLVFEERSPWPNLALDETGLNAAKQALYYILLRPGLPAREEHIATRLYNVYGFGYAAATDQADILWPAAAPPPTPEAAAASGHVETAWRHYRRCRMDQALAEISAAEALSLDEDTTHRLRWLRGMILYFTGNAETAAQVFPQPRETDDPRTWAMDKLTIALLAARLGHMEEAQRELGTVLQRDLRHRFIPIRIATIQALLALRDGRGGELRILVDHAVDLLIRERAELDQRLQQGKGTPVAYGLDPSALSALVVELLPAAVGLCDFEVARTLLDTIDGLFAPYLHLVRDDPLLAPLRTHSDLGPKVTSWIAEDWPIEEPGQAP